MHFFPILGCLSISLYVLCYCLLLGYVFLWENNMRVIFWMMFVYFRRTGVVRGTEYCGAETEAIHDPYFWRFSTSQCHFNNLTPIQYTMRPSMIISIVKSKRNVLSHSKTPTTFTEYRAFLKWLAFCLEYKAAYDGRFNYHGVLLSYKPLRTKTTRHIISSTQPPIPSLNLFKILDVLFVCSMRVPQCI